MPDYSCAPNCDINSTYIDMYQRDISQHHHKQHENDMKKIRRKFICCKCKKYPGDKLWSLGTWDNGPYTCFDCT